ncbi:MAG: hypothetical protein AB7E51_06350 [Pseudodesulfovibrio sp.]|uniref:hypothetical protein n=1 Tax=Pseudodesulfovibrio sp. TaxID=2035812 RepID=UPI003D0964EE
MSDSSPLLLLLRGCAKVLERILPYRVYRPLYVRVRTVYDRMAGNDPLPGLFAAPPPPKAQPVSGPGPKESPEPDLETLAVIEPPEPEAASEPSHGPVGGRDLAEPEGPVILCTGGTVGIGDLETVRVRCPVVVCCAFHGRHEVLELVVRESLHADVAVHWMLAGSSDEDRGFMERLAGETGRVSGLVCDNAPLGRKWQTCVRAAHRLYDADLYAITGSDDILSHRLIEHVVRSREADLAKPAGVGPDFYCVTGWLVHGEAPGFDPMLLKCSYRWEKAFQPLGAGRFYSRQFLDRVSGLVFDSGRARGLDGRGYGLVRELGGLVAYCTVEDGPVVSIKGEWEQLNRLETFFRVDTLLIEECSFEGYRLLRESLHPETFARLFATDATGLFC